MKALSMANPRYGVGDRVQVINVNPVGHVRTPWYVRGKIGTVERVCGRFANPEERAYARSGTPDEWLYRVRFLQQNLWHDYDSRVTDCVEVEIYQHWLTDAKPSR